MAFTQEFDFESLLSNASALNFTNSEWGGGSIQYLTIVHHGYESMAKLSHYATVTNITGQCDRTNGV